MRKHLPFDDLDMSGIRDAVNRYKKAGFHADNSTHQKREGIVRIAFANPYQPDGSIVIFEVHKLAQRTFFREQTYWVVQLFSQAPEESVIKRGCVAADTLDDAISNAESDGFVSVTIFEDAPLGMEDSKGIAASRTVWQKIANSRKRR
jgi:hypothetical protein